jgi:hypothetical protein
MRDAGEQFALGLPEGRVSATARERCYDAEFILVIRTVPLTVKLRPALTR